MLTICMDEILDELGDDIGDGEAGAVDDGDESEEGKVKLPGTPEDDEEVEGEVI